MVRTWNNGTLIIAGENHKMNSYEVQYILIINPAIPLFGIYPREVRTYANSV